MIEFAVPSPGKTHRAIWISDVHLGTRQCRAEVLLDFLKHHHAETWYLVGDMIDLLKLSKGGYWDATHDAVLDVLLQKARENSRVIYLPGNHDDFMRRFVNERFAELEIQSEWIHITRRGQRLLVLHGDAVDPSHHPSHASALRRVGDVIYEGIHVVNRKINGWRRSRNLPYWSLHRLFRHLGPVQRYIERYEEAICEKAQGENVHGVVCGHIHHVGISKRRDIHYYNTGDWVDACSALVEHFNGELELVKHSAPSLRKTQAPTAKDLHRGRNALRFLHEARNPGQPAKALCRTGSS